MVWESKEHKVNYLLKRNRIILQKIVDLLKEMTDNEAEMMRLQRRV